MKHTLYIDQLVVAHWFNKKLDPAKLNGEIKNRDRYLNHEFDLTDAAIVGFIYDLNPQNPTVRKYMYRGHFLITLKWLQEQMPLLKMGEQSLYRRLRWLRMMGILECLHKNATGNVSLTYYKLSEVFWKIHDKRHKAATEAAQKVRDTADPTVDDNQKSHSPLGLGPSTPGTTNASIKNALSSLPPPPAGVEAPTVSAQVSKPRKFGKTVSPWVTPEEAEHIQRMCDKAGREQREKYNEEHNIDDDEPPPVRDSLGEVPRAPVRKIPLTVRDESIGEDLARLTQALKRGDTQALEKLRSKAEAVIVA